MITKFKIFEKNNRSFIDIVRANDIYEVEKCLKSGDNNIDKTEYCLFYKMSDGNYGLFTPLKAAVRRNNLEMVKLLIKYGADLDIKCDDETALMLAAYWNNTEIIKELIKSGADLMIENEFHEIFSDTWKDPGNNNEETKNEIENFILDNSHLPNCKEYAEYLTATKYNL